MIRIILVDSHRLFRVSLKSLIDSFQDCQVITDVDSLKAIPKDSNLGQVDMVIFDPFSYHTNSSTFEEVQQAFPDSKIMILTDVLDRENVLKFIEAGISAFFSKADCPLKLRQAITEITQSYNHSEVRLGAVVRQSILTDIGYHKKQKVEFTERELQVLKLVCMEKTNAEISEILGVSVRTIESHRRRMIDKTDCKSIIGVILNALDFKILNMRA